jgi:hypothetical protein
MAHGKKMSGQIFISYRREESRWSARSLNDRLAAHFDRSQIFIDIDGIALGDDFVKTIEKRVGECDVLIAVIGARWLTSKDELGFRRLDNPEDFVRMEITTALRRDIRVIPVLVDGALMPQSTDLPDDLKPLVRRLALEVSDTRFDDDCRRLVAAIQQVLEKNTAEQRERAERERLDAERRETEKKERLEAELGQVNANKPVNDPKRALTLKEWRLRLAKKFSFFPFALALLTYFLVYWTSGRQLGNAIPESGIAILTDCLTHLDTFKWTVRLIFVLGSLCNIFMIISCFINYRRKAILEAIISSTAAILFVTIWSLGSWGSADERPEIGLHLACLFLAAGALVKAVLLKKERLESELRQVNVSEAVNNSERVLALQPGRLRLMKTFSFAPFALVLPTYFLVYWYYPDHPRIRYELSGIAFLTECGSIWEITGNFNFVLANLCNIFMLVSCFIQYRRKAILEAILSSSSAIVFVTLWSLGSAGGGLDSSVGLELRPGIGLTLACVFLVVGALVKTASLGNTARHERQAQQRSVGGRT